MDGYLDQQVPYTLANVRMDKYTRIFTVCNAFVSYLYALVRLGVCCMWNVWSNRLNGENCFKFGLTLQSLMPVSANHTRMNLKYVNKLLHVTVSYCDHSCWLTRILSVYCVAVQVLYYF